MMRLRRILRHLSTQTSTVNRVFPQRVREAVEAAVQDVEKSYDVFLRVVVEACMPLGALLRDQTSRERAIELFSLLRVWDTEHNSGVLIYVQLADQRIEIVADRGINAKVEQTEWDRICRQITEAFGKGRFDEGAMLGVKEISALLKAHVPPREPGEKTDCSSA